MKKKIVWLPYDFDTAIGINNEGALVFGYELEDTDHLEGGADIFNGQESVVWKNVRDAFPDELAAMYKNLRSTGALSYAKVEQMFEEHQGKWSEAIFNEDSWFKYIDPLVLEGSGAYLPMMQGSKAEQRKWWLYNRFRYIDSKYNAGDALSDLIQIRGYAKADVTVTPYADIYPTVKYGSYLVSQRGKRGAATTLVCPLDNVNDTEIYIYSASQLASVGDLSGFKVGFADFSMGTKLQQIKIGDSSGSYDNPNLNSLTLGNNVLLKKLDVRNCSALGTGDQKAVDISGCTNIEEVYFDGTAIQGVTLPVGGVLKKLHLPSTITNLTIRNQQNITELTIPSYANISTLRLENNSSVVNAKAILQAIPANSRVRIIGFYWEVTGASEIETLLDVLDTMRGLDENGNNVQKAQVSGTIHTASLTGAQVASYNERYPHITIDADMTTSYRYYHDEDGTLLKTVECHDGVPQSGAPTGMSKANSADGHYSYTFAGWTKTQGNTTPDDDALDNVIADRHIYAVYTAHVRTYTVTWKNSNGVTLETDTNVPWGTMPSYDGETPQNPTSGGSPFTRWTPTPAAITGNTTYTASYTPVYNVYFYNGQTLLDTVQVLQGGTAVYTGTTPTDGDKIFTGWSPEPTNVQGNLSVYAQFKANIETPTATTADGAYGVEWDYSQSSPALTRKGLAASFSDPAPAASVSGSGSSPFDSIAPWSGMKRYCVINGSYVPDTDARFDETQYDTLVYIPEFYYTAYKDTANSKWLWAVSPTAKTGYCKHPGSGRYVGRFHTGGSSEGVYTKSGVAPLVNTSQTSFRSYSAAKGTGWGMMDLATWSAIQILYLVEFANFDSQTTLGKGWNTGSAGTMGATGSAAYHTVKADGAHNQYRWIEDPFSNVYDWIDGFVGSKTKTYAAANDSYAGGNSDLNELGFALPSSGAIRGFGYSESAAWAFIPDTASGSDYTTYVTDRVNSNASLFPAYVGGDCSDGAIYGLFYLSAGSNASSTNSYLGSRLQKKP